MKRRDHPKCYLCTVHDEEKYIYILKLYIKKKGYSSGKIPYIPKTCLLQVSFLFHLCLVLLQMFFFSSCVIFFKSFFFVRGALL